MLLNRRRALLIPFLVLAATPGCPMVPAVQVHHAEVRGVSTFGVNLMIFLQVRNENPYDVQIRAVRCNVVLGRGAVLGPIEFAPNQWLPSNQTTLVAVPVSIPWTVVPSIAAESAGGYSIPYHIRGVADVTATRSLNIDRNNYQIDETGFVPRQMVVDAARSVVPIPF